MPGVCYLTYMSFYNSLKIYPFYCTHCICCTCSTFVCENIYNDLVIFIEFLVHLNFIKSSKVKIQFCSLEFVVNNDILILISHDIESILSIKPKNIQKHSVTQLYRNSCKFPAIFFSEKKNHCIFGNVHKLLY